MQPIISLRCVTRSFGATKALLGVSLDLAAGEIHALVGENGAGKTTLMNILSGVIAPDGGKIEIRGRAARLVEPKEAIDFGISTVFQELSLVDGLSIAENICGCRPPLKFGLIDRRAMEFQAQVALKKLGSQLNPANPVEGLLANERQIVEISKALHVLPKGGVLILDEPTSALNAEEKISLFTAVRRLAAEGACIIYISHHLDEVIALADRITVLRDGESIWTRDARELDVAEIVGAMVGREVTSREKTQQIGTRVVAELKGVTVAGRLDDVSVQLMAGEVLGVAGLDGSGREFIARVLAGIEGASGDVRLGGSRHPGTLRGAMALGVGYVPDDRKDLGLFLDFSIADNALAADLRAVTRLGLIVPSLVAREGAATIRDFGVKARDGDQVVRALSGGNQQKVLFAKWLRRDPTVLIVEEPTKGVDIGAKREIHDRLVAHARRGAAVLIASSDLPELLEVSDRILVMRQGRVAGVLNGHEASEEGVMVLAAGAPKEESHGQNR